MDMKVRRKFFKADEFVKAELFAATVKGEIFKKGSAGYTLELIFDEGVFTNLGNEYVVVWKE